MNRTVVQSVHQIGAGFDFQFSLTAILFSAKSVSQGGTIEAVFPTNYFSLSSCLFDHLSSVHVDSIEPAA